MKPPIFFGWLALGASLAVAAAVADVASTVGCPRSCCTCPDDYCSKSMPCVPCAPCGRCDDYCSKPLPCVPCAPRGCCDDYCPKPFSFCMPPCWPAWYTCGLVHCAAEPGKGPGVVVHDTN